MRRILQLSGCLLLALIYFSCEDSEEGCIDIFSNNFNFHAVTSCDSCCTYPAATFNFSLIHGDTTFNLNRDTFLLPTEDSFSISKLEIVFSDFEFIGDSDSYTVRDTVRNNSNTIKNDFVFFKTSASRTIGRTRFEDTIRTINFRVGFDQTEIERIKPFADIDQNIHLDEVLDSLYVVVDDKYLASRINILLKDSIRTLVLEDPVINNLVSFDVSIPIAAGIVWSIDCNLDVEILVRELTASMTNEEITEKLNAALTSALSLE